MTWVKIDDRFDEHEKVEDISDVAFRLHVSAMCFSSRRLTDGFVPRSRPEKLCRLRKPKDTIAELLAANLWHRSEHPCDKCVAARKAAQVTGPVPSGGYVIHEYHVYNPPKWHVLKERADRVRAGKLGAAARWGMAGAMADDKTGAIATPIAGAMAVAMAEPMANGWHPPWQADAPYPVPVPRSSGSIDPVSPRVRARELRTARRSSQRGGELVPIGVAMDRYLAKLQTRVEKGGPPRYSRPA